MDQTFKDAVFERERHMAEAIVSGEGMLGERMMAGMIMPQEVTPLAADVPGRSLVAGLNRIKLSGKLLHELVCLGARRHQFNQEPIEITDEMVRQVKHAVEERLQISLAQVEVVRIPAALWEGDNATAFVHPHAEMAPLVVMPQPCREARLTLVSMLAQAAHIVLRREDGDPAKVLADPASESFVEYAVKLPFLLREGGEEAFAYEMSPLMAGMYALAMMQFAAAEYRLPASVAELLASPMGAFLQDGLGQAHLEHCHQTLSSDQDRMTVEVRRTTGMLLALSLHSRPACLRKFMVNDTLANSMDEKIKAMFKERTDTLLAKAKHSLRESLKLARKADAEREGAILH